MKTSTHCERCGHGMADHNAEGVCSCSVEYGRGICACDNFLRAERTLPETLAAALFTHPGRDQQGLFYNQDQARRVGMLAEALLGTLPKTESVSALELLDAWQDNRIVNETRWYTLSRSDDGNSFTVHLYRRFASAGGNMWTYSSTQNARHCAAGAIMKFGAS